MKHIFFILLFVWGLWGCQDDEHFFDTSMPAENITFTPVAGGAIMHYRLPPDENILYIRVRYEDALGREIVRSGSYASDSLLLLGFNEAQSGVKARITLCDRNDVESDPMELSFDTRNSGAVSFFDSLEVNPDWNGIKLSYNLEEDAHAMAHVLYIGEDPVSKKPDTLLLSSFVLTKGENVKEYTFQQERDDYDIVVRTEDFRGYMVKEKVWEKVKLYRVEKLLPESFDFYDPEDLSVEDPEYRLGKSYLFDGDIKGENCFELKTFADFSTYLAGPYCLGKKLFVIDMKEEKLPAEIKLYAMLYVRDDFPSGGPHAYPPDNRYKDIWTGEYASKLPSNVTLYGSNNKDDDNSWEEIGHDEQDRYTDNGQRWCARANNGSTDYRIQTWDALEIVEPCSLRFACPTSGKKYRYLSIVVNEVFFTPIGRETPGVCSNDDKYVTFHELEIYTAK